MQSTPTLKDTDPHDVFAIEIAAGRACRKGAADGPRTGRRRYAAGRTRRRCKSRQHAAGSSRASDFGRRAKPAGRTDVSAADAREIPLENIRPGEINVSGLKLPGATADGQMGEARGHGAIGPVRRHGRSRLAALWRSGHGDGRRVGAAFRAGCIALGTKPAVAEQPGAPAAESRRNRSGRRATAGSGCGGANAARARRYVLRPHLPRRSTQLQSMAQDLATMGQQVEELKTTIAQLKASPGPNGA